MLDSIAKLDQENRELKHVKEILLDAVRFYAKDYHIRDYGNGQQVILEIDEAIDLDSDEDSFNYAAKTLQQIERMR